jgi:hypothetical protein
MKVKILSLYVSNELRFLKHYIQLVWGKIHWGENYYLLAFDRHFSNEKNLQVQKIVIVKFGEFQPETSGSPD